MVAGAGVGVDAELSRTTRLPSAMALRTSGFSRRCLLSMHSDCAISTFGPFSFVVSASLQRVAHAGDVVGAADRLAPTSTPTPRTACSIAWPVLRVGFGAFDDRMSCPPVAEV